MSDDRIRQMMDLVPDHWDKAPISLALEIRKFLETIIDAGTGIDSGGGDGVGDLWAKVDGVEYFISIRKSNAQLAKEGASGGQGA